MRRNVLKTIFLSCALTLGCASQAQTVATAKVPQAEPGYEVPADNGIKTARPVLVHGTNWTMHVPVGFEVKVTPEKPQPGEALTNELLAVTTKKFGRGPMVISVSVVDLVVAEMKPEGFPFLVLEAVHGDDTLKVVKEAEAELNGHKGIVVATINESGVLIFQFAFVLGKTGYLLRCGGDVLKTDDVGKMCSSVWKTFKTTK